MTLFEALRCTKTDFTENLLILFVKSILAKVDSKIAKMTLFEALKCIIIDFTENLRIFSFLKSFVKSIMEKIGFQKLPK